MPSTPAQPAFQKQLTVEILRGERLRTVLLAGFFGLILVGGLINSVFRLSGDLPQFGTWMPDNLVLSLSAAYVAYELYMYRFISRRLDARQAIATWAWYVNAFVETSSPTLALYFLGMSTGDLLIILTSPLLTLYFIFILLSVLRLNPALGMFTGCVAAVEYLGFSLFMIDFFPIPAGTEAIFLSRFYVERAIFLLLAGIGAGFVARQIRQWVSDSFDAYEDRRRIFQMFGQYTSPEIVDELLEHEGEVESQRKDVCIMFLDIRGFTAFAEHHPPEEVVAYLNRLLEFMIEAVNQCHGSVHQLLGDGFMAVFGVPASRGNDVQNAVDAARSIVSSLEEYTHREGLPPTRVGIGIHVGEAVVGPVGSAIHKEYKVTGDVVNVAARLEQLNKRFDSQILVSGSAWERIRKTTTAVTERGLVHLPGRLSPMEVYQLA